LEGPVIVRKRGKVDAVAPPDRVEEPAPGNDNRPETSTSMDDPPKSAIVTVKRRPGRFGDAPDLTPEEHRQRGDAADALFREVVRRARDTAAALAQLRQRPGAHARRSAGRAVRRVPVVVPAHHLRPLRQGPYGQREPRGVARSDTARHPQAHAP
jgi:hypothetical protein